jgi:peptide-methionine (R)-S-oxide reductase
MTVSRRFLLLGGTAAGAVAAYGLFRPMRPALATEGEFEITLSEEEWRARLEPGQFAVLRNHATEPPYSSPLNDEKRAGTFHCAGCALALFDSETKYDSGTGWPSFYDYLPSALGTSVDNALLMTRTEVHCSRCGGHQGHVFEDGPEPTGLRYCINGLALTFKEA